MFLALIVSSAGFALGQLGVLLAQTSTPTGQDLGPWVSAAGAAAAVSGMVYIAKMMADGKLVARDPAAVESRLMSIAERANQLTADSHQRESTYIEVIRGRP